METTGQENAFRFFFLRCRKNPRVSEWPPERSISFASPSDHQTEVFPLLCEYQVLRAATPHSNTGPPIFMLSRKNLAFFLKEELFWVRRMQRYHEITLWLFSHSVEILDIPQYRLLVL